MGGFSLSKNYISSSNTQSKFNLSVDYATLSKKFGRFGIDSWGGRTSNKDIICLSECKKV